MAVDSRGEGIFRPGDVLNNTYRIEAILGRGGTSEVYRARSEISGRVVALKALRSEYSRNEDFLALMTREEDMREIRHDGVVRYYDNQRTDDGTVYLVMDYVDGPSMEYRMRNGGMSAPDLLTVAGRVADALDAAHARRIVHRDLSPDNIILRNGIPAEAVIIDFGIAKDANPGAATIVGNEFAGKYAYAAPEQLSGDTDARSDLYALGALLLATFRGKAPEAGANPMEVVQNKMRPLDTAGVPEPLKTLIDRLGAPDRAARFQTAAEVLDFLRKNVEVDVDEGERTVILPRPRTTTAPPQARGGSVVPPRPATQPAAAPPPKAAPPAGNTPAPARKSGTGLILAGVAALLVAAGLGGNALGLFDGLLGPQLPVADPYVLIAEKTEAGSLRAAGSVPDEPTLEAIRSQIEAGGGTVELALATGSIAETWGSGMAALIGATAVLPEWRVEASGNAVTVSGLTPDSTQRAQLTQALAGLGQEAGLAVTVDIAFGPRFLTAEDIQSILHDLADCGELVLAPPPATGFAADATVSVTGQVATVETQVALNEALKAAIGGRTLDLKLGVQNPTLCTIGQALPDAPPGGFDIGFGFGDRPDPNPSGRYFVGENPVIDVTIPAGVTGGYLYVSALDVSGNIFHLLPNLNRPENSVTALRDGREGAVPVRVAYSVEERDTTDPNKLAFVVDETILGKTSIIVLHSDEPLFPALRPTTESAGGYAEALRAITVPVKTLDSRILTTAAP